MDITQFTFNAAAPRANQPSGYKEFKDIAETLKPVKYCDIDVDNNNDHKTRMPHDTQHTTKSWIFHNLLYCMHYEPGNAANQRNILFFKKDNDS